ncbi:unnamed protein product [Didymodactylos carnosus]|uniref:Uncharacterized protein n=1 Tax=Didymodactylos carnosus TaxID=1234261 RepID=A0A8S2NE74_9BILA|nr:unnamed protein product [Didymodactylos carnosus]CAF3990045.1 unnamed protein product [Didymodactylos carnosus]
MSSPISSVQKQNFRSLNNSLCTFFESDLFVYGLCHTEKMNTVANQYPLLSGFRFTYLTVKQRSALIFFYGNPIDMAATASLAPSIILQTTKQEFIDSVYQLKAVLVVDEAIYTSLLKEKERDAINNSDPQYDDIFLFPGDWHFTKNLFGIVGKFISGSGIEHVFQVLYDQSVVVGILGVYDVDRTFRAYTLLFITLFLLQIENFADENPITEPVLTSVLNNMKDTVDGITKQMKDENINENMKDTFKQSREILNMTDIVDDFNKWREKKSKMNIMFKYYDFLLYKLLKQIFILYIATRTNNFQVRNEQWRYFIPFFFAFNHTNYARMSCHHVYEITQMDQYLKDELTENWTVMMKDRPFSSIACDYAIESTQNKDFKGPAGLTGHMDCDLRTAWALTSPWCAEIKTVVDELANNKLSNNPHVQATQSRIATDNQDLKSMLMILRTDNPFTSQTKDFHKILSGVVISVDIVNELCAASTKFLDVANSFINQHVVGKKTSIFTTISKGNVRLLNTTTALPKTITKTTKETNEKLLRTLIHCSIFRPQASLEKIFKHEFAEPPLSFMNKNDITFQQKSNIISYLTQYFPSAITNIIQQKPLVMILDGNALIAEQPRSNTYEQYALNMFTEKIMPLTSVYNRIDIIFSHESDCCLHDITQKDEQDNKLSIKELKGSFRMPKPTEWAAIIENNRLVIGQCICQIWESSNTFKIPADKLVMVSCPDKRLFLLTSDSQHQFVQNIIVEQHDINIRLIAHSLIQINGFESSSVLIKSKQNDLIVLAVIKAPEVVGNLLVENCYRYRDKNITRYIDCSKLHDLMKEKYKTDNIEIFSLLHALSGSDYTSCIKGITKTSVVNTYFNNPMKYKNLKELMTLPTKNEVLHDCERLLLDVLKSKFATLDEHRLNVVKKSTIKYDQIESLKTLPPTLPPTSDAAYLHFARAAVAYQMWFRNTQLSIGAGHGYEIYNGVFSVKWIMKGITPSPVTVIACSCKSGGCTTCLCATNNLKCVSNFCSCDQQKCSRR